MSDDRRQNLNGWLASVRLSELEEEALARVPEAVLKDYCDELLGSRVPRALNSWYPERDIKAWGGLCPVGNTGYSRLAAHHLMLSDRVRIEAFDSAIRCAIQKGDVVVDVGTGTGILSLMACRAGAARVYAIERDEVAALAAEVISLNGWSAVANVIAGDATHVVPREPADVLISECIGSGGVGTAQIVAVLDSRRRWLRRGGVIIPQSVTVIVAPVESVLTELYLRFWESKPGGFEYHPASAWARDQMYTAIVRPEELLATPSSLFELRYDAIEYKGFETEVTCHVTRQGTIHGLGVWFRAGLVEGISLDTSPGQPLTHWYQCFLPLRHGLAVQAGDTVQVLIGHRYEEEDSVWDWSVREENITSPITRQTTSGSTRRCSMPKRTVKCDLYDLAEIIRLRVDAAHDKSYTRRLLNGGVELYGAKVIEEAHELARAADSEGKTRTIEEAADLMYHTLVLLRGQGIEITELMDELDRRRR